MSEGKGYFEVGGAKYELVPWEDWTFAENMTFQRVSGLPAGRLITGMGELDVNAYLGMFVVSMQRVDPSKTERDLTGLNFMETIENIVRVVEEPDPEPDPPTAPPSDNGENGAATFDQTLTLEPSGTPPGSGS